MYCPRPLIEATRNSDNGCFIAPRVTWVCEATHEDQYGLTIRMGGNDVIVADDWVGRSNMFTTSSWPDPRAEATRTVTSRRDARAAWVAAAEKAWLGHDLTPAELQVIEAMSLSLSYYACGRLGEAARAIETLAWRKRRRAQPAPV